MMEIDTLKKIGLSDGEIKVYFALLELESGTVGPIIEKAHVPDSKIYAIIDKLKEKGLVSFVIKNNVRHFQASDPKNLIRLLDEREREIVHQKRVLERHIIPMAEARRKLTEDKQEAIVYESWGGLKSAFNLILENVGYGGSYVVFTPGEELKDRRIIRFYKNYHKNRIKKNIKIRLLSPISIRETIMKYHISKGLKFRFTDQKFPLGIYIFKNHVMTIVWEGKPTAFVIKSRKNYEFYKEFFEDMWSKAK